VGGYIYSHQTAQKSVGKHSMFSHFQFCTRKVHLFIINIYMKKPKPLWYLRENVISITSAHRLFHRVNNCRKRNTFVFFIYMISPKNNTIIWTRLNISGSQYGWWITVLFLQLYQNLHYTFPSNILLILILYFNTVYISFIKFVSEKGDFENYLWSKKTNLQILVLLYLENNGTYFL
jgi:hypothetical protein